MDRHYLFGAIETRKLNLNYTYGVLSSKDFLEKIPLLVKTPLEICNQLLLLLLGATTVTTAKAKGESQGDQ